MYQPDAIPRRDSIRQIIKNGQPDAIPRWDSIRQIIKNGQPDAIPRRDSIRQIIKNLCLQIAYIGAFPYNYRHPK
jgi:hypothetical protein